MITAKDFPRQLTVFAETLATGNFDADAYPDLAVGVAPGGEDAEPHTGEVRIVYGSSVGLTSARSQLWQLDSPGVPGRGESDDGFGASMIAGNFGHGDHDDLAIGARGHGNERGAVSVLYGSPTGLSAEGSQFWTQGSAGVPGSPAAGERFGEALAAGNFTGGAYDDLAIGVPADGAVNHDDGPGAVDVLYGSAAGLTSEKAQRWSQATPGVKGRAVNDEQFGRSLAAGHFAGRTSADLAIGVTSDRAVREYGGAVNVLYGSPRGLTAAGNRIFHRRTPGLADPHKLDTFLGWGRTARNFGRDSGQPRDATTLPSAPRTTSCETVPSSAVESSRFFTVGLGIVDPAQPKLGLAQPGSEGSAAPVRVRTSPTAPASPPPIWPIRRLRRPRSRGLVQGADDNHYGAISVLDGSTAGLTARGDELWTAKALRRDVPRFLNNVPAHSR